MPEKLYELHRVSGQAVSDAELLADMRRVAESLGKITVGQKEYRRLGRFSDTTPTRRFGSWNRALEAAELAISNVVNLSDDELFENILILWQYYGRQPRRRELALAPSRISQSPYRRRFRSWTEALERFVEYANANEPHNGPSKDPQTPGSDDVRRTPRDPSVRLRFKVLQRDRFCCCACGASPAKTPGITLHVDHVVPWSKGGETTIDNLQTLCK
jgi:5-methylcytosine-specific restriction endonuclease McrA